MIDEIFVNAGLVDVRVALLQQGVLTAFHQIPHTTAALQGNIYRGRVGRIEPAFQAAFVDIGEAQAGFLAARDVVSSRAAKSEPVERRLTEGEAVLVQVTKDADGDKGPRLSMNVRLAGRYLVLAPQKSGIEVARRIKEPAIRQRLQTVLAELVNGAGNGRLTARTAAANASIERLQQDYAYLSAQWHTLTQNPTKSGIPSCHYRAQNPVITALIDHPDVQRVVIDDAALFRETLALCEARMPDLCAKLQHHHSFDPLFDRYDLDAQIESALSPTLPLPSGGWIALEPTEALTVVDVNAGHDTHARNRADTALNCNLEAASLFARQARLRNIAGLVVIDFLSMSGSGHVRRLLQHLRTAFADDPAAVQIGPMSAFGLVEMTRERRASPLHTALFSACLHCDGTGRQSNQHTRLSALCRAVEREAAVLRTVGKLTLTTSSALHTALMAGDPSLLQQLQNRIATPLQLMMDPQMASQDYAVSRS